MFDTIIVIYSSQNKYFNFSEEDLLDFSAEEKNYFSQISEDSKSISQWKQVINFYFMLFFSKKNFGEISKNWIQ